MRLLGRADNGVRDGLYRDALEIRTAAGSGLNAINAVGMESYLLGVVPGESPASWPPAALQAQAVAARSYALASNVNGKGFEQYADTRSQVYRGYLAEAPSTNAAVAATDGEVVTYGGEVATTFFFSTSGGYTENVENVFTGGSPRALAEGREGPLRRLVALSPLGAVHVLALPARAKARELGEGPAEELQGAERGVSPRVVKARVRGTGGSTVVTGPQVRRRMGLRDTWFSVRRVRTSQASAEARTLRGARPLVALHGTVDGVRLDSVTLQRGAVTIGRRSASFPSREGTYRMHVGTQGSTA